MKFIPRVKIHTHHSASSLRSPKLTQLGFSDSRWGGGVGAGGHGCKMSLHSADMEELRPRPGSVSSKLSKVGLGPGESARHCSHLPGPRQEKRDPSQLPQRSYLPSSTTQGREGRAALRDCFHYWHQPHWQPHLARLSKSHLAPWLYSWFPE